MTGHVDAGRLAEARRGAELIFAVGAIPWPGATHFLVLEVDRFGSLIGDAQVICRACAREAACRVLERFKDLDAADSCRDNSPYLELVGDSGAPDAPARSAAIAHDPSWPTRSHKGRIPASPDMGSRLET